MPLVNADAVRRIEGSEGEWLDLLAMPGLGHIIEALDSLGEGADFTALRSPSPRVTRALLTLLIKDWSFEAPVTVENVDRLDVALASSAIAAMWEILNGPPPKKGKRSSTGSPTVESPTS